MRNLTWFKKIYKFFTDRSNPENQEKKRKSGLLQEGNAHHSDPNIADKNLVFLNLKNKTMDTFYA